MKEMLEQSGFGSSFLDLLFSALSAMLIITAVSPRNEVPTAIFIHVAASPIDDAPAVDLLVELELGEDTYSSSAPETDEVIWKKSPLAVTAILWTTSAGADIEVFVAVEEDRAALSIDHKYGLTVSGSGIQGFTTELAAGNLFCTKQ